MAGPNMPPTPTPGSVSSAGPEVTSLLNVGIAGLPELYAYLVKIQDEFKSTMEELDKVYSGTGKTFKKLGSELTGFDKTVMAMHEKLDKLAKLAGRASLLGSGGAAGNLRGPNATLDSRVASEQLKALNEIIRGGEAELKVQELIAHTQRSQIQNMMTIKELMAAQTLEERKLLLAQRLGNQQNEAHAQNTLALIKSRLLQERMLKDQQEASLRRQQSIAQYRRDAMYSPQMMAVQQRLVDRAVARTQQRYHRDETLDVVDRTRLSPAQLQRETSLATLGLERLAIERKIKELTAQGRTLALETEKDTLRLVTERMARLEKQRRDTIRQAWETAGQTRERQLQDTIRAARQTPEMINLRRWSAGQAMDRLLDRHTQENTLAQVASSRMTEPQIQAEQSIGKLLIERMAAVRRMNELKRDGLEQELSLEHKVYTAINDQIKLLQKGVTAHSNPKTAYQQFREFTKSSFENVVMAVPRMQNALYEMRFRPVQNFLEQQNYEQMLAHISNRRVPINQISNINDIGEVRLQQMAARWNIRQAGRSNNEAMVKAEQEYLDALNLRAAELRREGANSPMLRTQRINQQRQDMRERVMGDAGASMSLVQAGFMFNNALLGGITGLFGGATQAAIKFEESLRNLQAIAAVSNTEMFKLKDGLIEVAKNSRFSAVEVANAATLLAQAGLNADQIRQSMKAVLTLAQATGSDLTKSVDVTTSVMNIFEKQASDTTDIANKLTEAVNRSKLDIEKLSLGIQYAGNTAAQSGIRMEELVAGLGAMANAGIRSGSTLGTGFSQIITGLVKPSEHFQQVLERLGLTLQDVDIQTHGLEGVMVKLRDNGFTAADAMQSFEQRGARAFIAFSKNLDVYRNLIDGLNDTTAAAEANAIQMESLAAKSDKLKTNLGLMAAEGLAPVNSMLKNLVDGMSHAAQGSTAISSALQVVTTGFVALGSGVALAWLLKYAKGLTFIAGAQTAFTLGLAEVSAGLGQVGRSTTIATAGMTRLEATMVMATGAATGLARAAAGARAALSAMLGPWGMLLTGGILIGSFVSFTSKADKLAEALDKAKAKLSESRGETDKTTVSITKVDEALAELNQKYGVLKNDSEATAAMARRLQGDFRDLGLNIKNTATAGVDELIQKLQSLRGELSAEYVIKIRKEGEDAQSVLRADIAAREERVKQRTLAFRGTLLPELPGFAQNQTLIQLAKLANSGDFSAAGMKAQGFGGFSDISQARAQVMQGLMRYQGNPAAMRIQAMLRDMMEQSLGPLLDEQEALQNRRNQLPELVKRYATEGNVATQIRAERANPDSAYHLADTVTQAYKTLLEDNNNLHDEGGIPNRVQIRKNSLDFLSKNLPLLQDKIKAYKAEQKSLQNVTTEVAEARKGVLEDLLASLGAAASPLLALKDQLDLEGATQKKKDLEEKIRRQNKEIEETRKKLGDTEHLQTQAQVKALHAKLRAQLADKLASEQALADLNNKMEKKGVTTDNQKRELTDAMEAQQEMAKDTAKASSENVDQRIKQIAQEHRRRADEILFNDMEQSAKDAQAEVKNQLKLLRGGRKGRLDELSGQIQDLQSEQLQAYVGQLRAQDMLASSDPNVRAQGRLAARHNAMQGFAAVFSRKAAQGRLKDAQDAENLQTVAAIDKAIAELQQKLKDVIQAPLLAAEEAMKQANEELSKLEQKAIDQNRAFTPEEQKRAERLKQNYDDASGRASRLQGLQRNYQGTIADLQRQKEQLLPSIMASIEDKDFGARLAKTISEGMDAAQSQMTSGFGDIMTKLETRALRGAKNIREAFKAMGAGILETMLQVINNEIAKKFVTMLFDLGMSGFSTPTAAAPGKMMDFAAPRGGGGRPVAYHGGIPIKGFAFGGWTGRGADLGRDDRLAMLAPNEYVLPASTVSYLGKDFLDETRRTNGRNIMASAPQNPVKSGLGHVQQQVNVWVVSPDQKPPMTHGDVVVAVQDDIARGGTIKKMVQAVVQEQRG